MTTASETAIPARQEDAQARPRALSLADRFWRGAWLTLLLGAADIAAFACLWLAAYELRRNWNVHFVVPINELAYYVQSLGFIVPVWVAAAAANGLYAHREKISSLAEARSLMGAAKDGLIGSFAVAFLLREQSVGRSVVVLASCLNVAWLCASRLALRELKRRALEKGLGLRRAIIVGSGAAARRVVERVACHPEIGYRLEGFVAQGKATSMPIPPGPRSNGADSLARLGKPSDLPTLIARLGAENVFIAAPEMGHNEVLNLVSRCEGSGANFYLCANILEVITDRVKVDDIGDLPVIPFRGTAPAPLQAFAKRALDLASALILLAVFAVPMLLIGLAIRLLDGGPALFSQKRAGLKGREFTILKFRTMTTDTPRYADAPSEASDPRVTPFGRFLRKTSLDELPQLFNVLAGQMSMVGPRPEMPHIVARYEEWQRRRLDAKPGVTGLWQVVGRKNLPLSLNLEYDFYYIKNQSLALDVVILLRTIPAVIFGRGAF